MLNVKKAKVNIIKLQEILSEKSATQVIMVMRYRDNIFKINALKIDFIES